MYPFIRLGVYTIPLYGLFLTIGFVCASAITLVRVKRMQGDTDYSIVIIAFTFMGAMAGGFFVYLFASYGIKNVIIDIQEHNWNFLRNPGIVFYGGLVGGVLGALLGLSLFREVPVSLFAKAAVPTIPLGHAIGRLGCLFAGCCYGLPYDGPLSVHLTTVEHRVFPIQIVESFLNVILFVLIIFAASKIQEGLIVLALYLCSYSLIRFFLEFYRGDQIRGVYSGLSTSQWISIAIFVGSVIFFALFIRRKRTSYV